MTKTYDVDRTAAPVFERQLLVYLRIARNATADGLPDVALEAMKNVADAIARLQRINLCSPS